MKNKNKLIIKANPTKLNSHLISLRSHHTLQILICTKKTTTQRPIYSIIQVLPLAVATQPQLDSQKKN